MIKHKIIFKLLSFSISFILLLANTSAFAMEMPQVQEQKEIKIQKIEYDQVQQSPIEKSFDLELKQIGYEIFNNTSSEKEQGDTFQKDHKLSVGDKVKVYFWGDSVDMLALTGKSSINPLEQSEVDTNGNLFVPGIGAVPAEGKTIDEVERKIKYLTGSKYSNARVQLSLDSSADFSVFVYGFVKKPGKAMVSNNSSIIEVLSAAGGIDKNGSLRTVLYESGKTLQIIDLYELILKGKSPNIKIKAGDKFFVNPIGNTVALKNGVKVPGIYEVKPDEKIENLVSYAGWFMPNINKTDLLIERYDPTSRQREAREFDFSALNSIAIANGDIVSFKTLYKETENYVEVMGNVKHPAVYQYEDGMLLSDLIKSQADLLNNTYTGQAVIDRIYGPNKEIKSIPVSLRDFFSGGVDPELMPQDVIKIYPSTKMETVEVAGYVKNPGLIPYKKDMTLNELLKSVELGSNTKYIPVANHSEIDPSQLVAEITFKNKEKDQDIEEIITVYLYELMIKNNKSENIILEAGDKVLFRPIRHNEVLKTVRVYGYVNNPGSFKLKPGTRLADALNEAGGISADGYLKGIVLIRPAVASEQQKALKNIELRTQSDTAAEVLKIQGDSTLEQTSITEFKQAQKEALTASAEKTDLGRINLRIKRNDLSKLKEEENIEIKDGDEIYIPQKSNHVIVMGEVYNQSGFSFIDDMNVKDYIKKAGGFTKLAEKGDVYVISANGFSSQVGLGKDVEPGDTIIIPKRVEKPINWVELVKNIAQIGFNAFNSVFILTKI